jgi:predicted ATPase
LYGDLFAHYGSPPAAIASYEQAISIARRQGSRLFELRAATSLARVAADQGNRQQARDVLASVYGWFNEDLDALDLEEARALLDTLGS